MNWLVLGVVVLTIGCGVLIAYNIDDSIGDINDYCRTNRLGFVNDVNCTVWNAYRPTVSNLPYVYDVVEYCDQHGNNSGNGSCKDAGIDDCIYFTCNVVNVQDLMV